MSHKNKKLISQQQHPFFIFITGASGAGKTYLVKALKNEMDLKRIHIEYFDGIGVPSLEEMVRNHGSGEKWQEATTHEWVQRLALIRDKAVIVLEGQFNPHFALDACKEAGIEHYQFVAIHADKGVREQRLIHQRAQPELVNEEMNNWAEFLKRKTEELGGEIIDASASNTSFNLNELACLIRSCQESLRGEKAAN